MFVLAMEFWRDRDRSDLGRGWRTSLTKVSVAMAVGSHPFPFRTRKLSPPAPMVLGSRLPGRVGRRRISQYEGPFGGLRRVRARVGRRSRVRCAGRWPVGWVDGPPPILRFVALVAFHFRRWGPRLGTIGSLVAFGGQGPLGIIGDQGVEGGLKGGREGRLEGRRTFGSEECGQGERQRSQRECQGRFP